GEKSYFRVEVKQQDKTIMDSFREFKRNTPFIFCASDCFVDASVLDKAAFAVNSHVSFRNLQSKVQRTSNYSGLSDKDVKQLKRSHRFNLLQRGSVLYFTDNNILNEVLTQFDKKHCQTIGFNIITKP
ncbi:MAG: hypothetical protein RML37_11380, partial [Chitinophagales bacterium]|nr:hypothetical protein [Chitinophagales bacterium]